MQLSFKQYFEQRLAFIRRMLLESNKNKLLTKQNLVLFWWRDFVTTLWKNTPVVTVFHSIYKVLQVFKIFNRLTSYITMNTYHEL